jgi:hypothetical protein
MKPSTQQPACGRQWLAIRLAILLGIGAASGLCVTSLFRERLRPRW